MPRAPRCNWPPRRTSARSPRVSGSLEAHYAPRTRLQLVAAADLAATAGRALDAGLRVAALAAESPILDHPGITWRPASVDPVQFAHELYASLRELDAMGRDLILVAVPPDAEAWRAVGDRLRRAAAGSK